MCLYITWLIYQQPSSLWRTCRSHLSPVTSFNFRRSDARNYVNASLRHATSSPGAWWRHQSASDSRTSSRSCPSGVSQLVHRSYQDTARWGAVIQLVHSTAAPRVCRKYATSSVSSRGLSVGIPSWLARDTSPCRCVRCSGVDARSSETSQAPRYRPTDLAACTDARDAYDVNVLLTS